MIQRRIETQIAEQVQVESGWPTSACGATDSQITSPGSRLAITVRRSKMRWSVRWPSGDRGPGRTTARRPRLAAGFLRNAGEKNDRFVAALGEAIKAQLAPRAADRWR